MTDGKRQNLAAVCGLYCGACVMYLAGKRGDTESLAQMAEAISAQEGQEVSGMPPMRNGSLVSPQRGRKIGVQDLICEGCLSSDVVASHCRLCAFRACAFEKGLLHCSDCADSPCQELVDFSNDGFPHHGEVLANMQRQREIDIDSWIAEQEKVWRCPQCLSAIDWYASECPGCGATLKGHFDLPEGMS